MVSSLSLPPPPLTYRHPTRRTSISFFLLGLGRILAACFLLVLAELPGADQHEGEVERDALIAILEPACATSDAKRAAIALSRMHGRGEQDAAVHCWLAGVLAEAAADPDGAYKECRKAFFLSPSQPCSIYCLSHFLLWHAEWQSLEAVAPMARAAVDIELEQGRVPSLAYLEALLLLPTQTLHRLLSSRAQHLLLHQSTFSASGQEQEQQQQRQQQLLDRWWISPSPPAHPPPHHHPPSASLSPLISEGSAAAIRVVFICAAARDHPHGRVLLDVLEGLGKGRSGEKDAEMAPSSSSSSSSSSPSSLPRGGEEGGAGGGRERGGGAGGWQSQGRRRKGEAISVWPTVEAACIFTGPAPDNGDATRKRIESTCAHSIQLGVVASPSQIAAAVNEGRAHVAVDVDGWAQGAHVAAMKLRPAPVSMLFIGHVGSAGVEGAHDYVFTDRVSSPPELADAYTERLLITPLGRSYFISSAFSTPPPRPPRSSLGLPEDGIVVSCMSAVFKMSPALLHAWARLLIDSSQAVLWLPSYPIRARTSIKRELESRGVVQSSKRLFWAQTFADGDAHVAGKSGSDVALDPMWFNGHSSAVDSMRSCVPLVTLPGEGMHSRVASSLALSLGGEGGGGAAARLVARNVADYIELAAVLLRNRDALVDMRAWLVREMRGSSVFDGEGWADGFRSLVRMSMETASAQGGSRPHHNIVAAIR